MRCLGVSGVFLHIVCGSVRVDSTSVMSEWTFVERKSKKWSSVGAKRNNNEIKPASAKNSKNKLTNAVLLDNSDSNVISIESDEFKRKLSKYTALLEATTLYNRVAETVAQLSCPVQRFVVLGVGKILSSDVSFLQFALAVVLRRLLACRENFVLDPVMSVEDHKLCAQEEFIPMSRVTNDIYEAKHCTFFFMPHCPYRLYNHVLYINWEVLHNVVILGNSFESYRCRKIGDIDSTDTMLYLSKYISETSIVEDKVSPLLQHYDRAFNDTSIMVLNRQRMSDDIYSRLLNEKPSYERMMELYLSDSEIITT